MKEIEQYKNADKEIAALFNRLPHTPALLAQRLMAIADPNTGMVTGLTWHDVSMLLYVDKKPGRQNTGAPSKDQTREYINTILQQCGDDFKIATVGQKLQFQFPNMPAIYAKHITTEKHPTVINTDLPIPKSLEQSGLNGDFNRHFTREVPTELPTAESPVKNNIIFNKNNNNITTTHEDFPRKKLISKDFYPTQETIEKAFALGYVNPTDPAVIQSFIEKNTAWGSVYFDFNPIYLLFLAKEPEFKQQKQLEQESLSRSKHHERTQPKNNTFEAAMEQVLRDNPDPLAPSDELPRSAKTHCFDVLDSAEHPMVMEGVSQTVRPTIHQQTWQQR